MVSECQDFLAAPAVQLLVPDDQVLFASPFCLGLDAEALSGLTYHETPA